MKRYLDLVPISAKVHRKQSRMSIFCIILAVFLVTTIFGMADMFIRSQILQTKIENGSFHIGIRDITDEQVMLISKRPDIKAAARYGVINYRGDQEYLLSGKNAIIAGCDEQWVTEMLVDFIIQGDFPQTDKQAMITESAKQMLNLQIGDEITIDGPDKTKISYTISGFCKNASKTMSEDSYGLFITTDAFRNIYWDIKSDNLSDYNSMLYIEFKNEFQVQNEIRNLKDQCKLSDEQISENTKLLGLIGQSTNSLMLQVYAAAGILFLLVMFAGIMMITSSLNSNIAQRTEFFGLMRCIGATPKQIMRMVRKEALRWCRFAIPVGILIGILVIWILCTILRFLSPEYFMAMPIFSISVPSIVAGIVLGLLTVLLASRSPAKKAAKVSPLSAVSGNTSSLMTTKKAINTKLFKVDTALGIHHAKASRKNLFLMTISFALSIILFLSFSVTIEFMNHTLTPLRPWTEDIYIKSPDNSCSIDNTIVGNLQNNPVVKSVYGCMIAYNIPVKINGTEETVDLVSYEQHQFDWAKRYLLDGSIEKVQNNTNTGLIVYKPQNTIQTGDTITMDIAGQSKKITITGILSDSSFKNANDIGIIICSEDTFKQITGISSDYTVVNIQLTKDATDDDVNTIHQMVGSELIFSDERMENSSTLGTYYCLWLFVYGFLVLIALITVFNIINSIAMSVSAKIKQYGVFRAIGLSAKQLTKMIIAEALTYTVIGSIIGTILGLVCNYFLFEILISSNWGDTWIIPWIKLIVIILIIMISLILAVYKPIKRIRNMSIVDTISAQ